MKKFFKHVFSALMLFVAFHAFGGETLLAKGDKAAASKSAKKGKKADKGKDQKKGAKSKAGKKGGKGKGKGDKKKGKEAKTKVALPASIQGKLNIIKEKTTCTAKLGKSTDIQNFAKIEQCVKQAGEKNPNFVSAVSESGLCEVGFKKPLTGKDRKRVDSVCTKTQSIISSAKGDSEDSEEAAESEDEGESAEAISAEEAGDSDEALGSDDSIEA